MKASKGAKRFSSGSSSKIEKFSWNKRKEVDIVTLMTRVQAREREREPAEVQQKLNLDRLNLLYGFRGIKIVSNDNIATGRRLDLRHEGGFKHPNLLYCGWLYIERFL